MSYHYSEPSTSPCFPHFILRKSPGLRVPTRPCEVWLLIPLWSHTPFSPSLALSQPHWPSPRALNRPGLPLTQRPRHLCDSFSRLLQVFTAISQRGLLDCHIQVSQHFSSPPCSLFFSLALSTHTHTRFHLIICFSLAVSPSQELKFHGAGILFCQFRSLLGP